MNIQGPRSQANGTLIKVFKLPEKPPDAKVKNIFFFFLRYIEVLSSQFVQFEGNYMEVK